MDPLRRDMRTDDPGTDDQEASGPDEPTAVPVEPGSPSAENVAFVVLGALLAVFAFARIVGLV